MLGRQAAAPTPADLANGFALTAHFLEQSVLAPHDKPLPEAGPGRRSWRARSVDHALKSEAIEEWKTLSVNIVDDIRPEQLSKALSERYLAYALSTITQRALPDARDGLKPVHRRLLHAMRELKLDPESGFKKCARVVGDVIGKFHPHGDQAVYDALVRLAQDFAVRYPLVEGQGNFGNVDGDNAAAMRYTESRLTPVAQALLDGLDEDAVDFRATYDGEDREPVVLPAAFPNLLANGSTGIAVGMATSIPPHNAGELCQALIALVENPKVQDRTIFKAVKGPDFPTGGIIVDDPATIQEAYRTGRGSFRVRARWKREEGARGAYQIVVDQIPYQVQKAKLIERIAALIEEKKLPLLDDVRDESAEDIRIVLVPKEPHGRTRDPDGAIVPPDRAGIAHPAEPQRARQGRLPTRDELARSAGSLHRSPPRRAEPSHQIPPRENRRPAGGAGRLSRRLSEPRQGHQDHPHRGRAEAEADEGVQAHRPPGRSDPQHAAARLAPARGNANPRRAHSLSRNRRI